MEYRLNQCALLHLDAGKDSNGLARRAYALVYGPTGQILAVAAYGGKVQASIGDALREILGCFRHGSTADCLMHELIVRSNGERVRVAPSYLTHLLRREAKERTESLVHGKPTLTVD